MVDSNKKRRKVPLIEMRRVVKLGKSYYISIPKEWYEAHGLDLEKVSKILIIADKDIRIVNPEHEEEVYKEVSKIAKKAKI